MSKTFKLSLSTEVKAVLSDEWCKAQIEGAQIHPDNGGDVFLHTLYQKCHQKSYLDGVMHEADTETFLRAVFANGMRKMMGNTLAAFLSAAEGVAGTVSPAKVQFQRVTKAEQAKLKRMDVPPKAKLEVPELPKPYAPKLVADADRTFTEVA